MYGEHSVSLYHTPPEKLPPATRFSAASGDPHRFVPNVGAATASANNGSSHHGGGAPPPPVAGCSNPGAGSSAAAKPAVASAASSLYEVSAADPRPCTAPCGGLLVLGMPPQQQQQPRPCSLYSAAAAQLAGCAAADEYDAGCVDCWQLGVLAFQLLHHGHLPFYVEASPRRTAEVRAEVPRHAWHSFIYCRTMRCSAVLLCSVLGTFTWWYSYLIGMTGSGSGSSRRII